MTRAAGLLVLAAAAAFFLVPSAEARYFAFRCTANQNLQVDPIVQPGVYPSAHLHTFYAAKGVNQYSDLVSLEASPGTSCGSGVFFDNTSQHPLSAAQIAANTAGIWLPTMIVGGAYKNPLWATDYWSNTSQPGATLVNVPEGLQFIGGDPHATSPPPEYELYWDCGDNQKPAYPSSTRPLTCPSTGPGLLAHIEFPTCWDGAGLGFQHVFYAYAPTPFTEAPKFAPCPMFSQTIPHIQIILHTGLRGAVGAAVSFSSGPYYTLHADYWQSWHDQPRLASLETFLRTGATPS